MDFNSLIEKVNDFLHNETKCLILKGSYASGKTNFGFQMSRFSPDKFCHTSAQYLRAKRKNRLDFGKAEVIIIDDCDSNFVDLAVQILGKYAVKVICLTNSQDITGRFLPPNFELSCISDYWAENGSNYNEHDFFWKTQFGI